MNSKKLKLEEQEKTITLIKKLARENVLSFTEYVYVIEHQNQETFKLLKTESNAIRQLFYGNKVYLRGLIEFSNYCKQGCYYCGLNCANNHVVRYRLSIEEIMNCVNEGYALGFRTFVLQSGDDPFYDDEMICQIIRTIKAHYQDVRVTLSIGEKEKAAYQKYYDAGCDRYLLRHEAASEALYNSVHPQTMNLGNRKLCLKNLKAIGYQTGAGFMVGLPNQTAKDLAMDILFLKELNPEMIGIGPFIPHSKTRYHALQGGDLDTVILMIALVRLTLPKALIPATTALGTLSKTGREQAISAGANVIMPNLSPINNKKNYELYENKICLEDSSLKCRSCIELKLKAYAFEIDMSVGDHPDFSNGGKK